MNQEHYDILQKGIKEFNKWRIEKQIKADLKYVDLKYADLSDANLRYADLRYVDLRYADLSGVDLKYADLRYADLRYADLRYADLRYANLRYADLDFTNWLRMACKSFDTKIDEQNFFQLCYHFCRLDCEDAEVIKIQNYLMKFANKADVIKRHNLSKIKRRALCQRKL